MSRRAVVLRVDCRSSMLPLLPARRAVLCYRVDEPLAVTISVGVPGRGPRTWTFARALLDEGLRVASGAGDVRLRPDPARAVVELVLGALSCPVPIRVAVSEGALDRFLASTYALLPRARETERLGVDRWLDRLLA